MKRNRKPSGQDWHTLDNKRLRWSFTQPHELRFDLRGTIPDPIYVGPDDGALARKLIHDMRRCKWVAIDEENDMDAAEKLILWSFSTGDNRVVVHHEATRFFKDWLENAPIKRVFHNAMHDVTVFSRNGLNVPFHADTMIMDFYADENRDARVVGNGHGHGLKDCAYDWLGISMADLHVVFTGKPGTSVIPDLRERMLSDLPRAMEYASLDAYATYWLFKLLRKVLKASKVRRPGCKKNLWDVCRTYEPAFLLSLAHAEQRGASIDIPSMQQVGRELEKTLARSKHVLPSVLPVRIVVNRQKDGKPTQEAIPSDEINLGSPQQMAAVFYDVLGLKSVYDEPEKARSVDALCLQEWASEGVVLAEVVQSYRTALKMRQDFVGYLRDDSRGVKKGKPNERYKGLLYWATHDPLTKTHVIRTSFNPIGAATGRASARDPNLQQIPADKAKDPHRIRRAFIPRKGGALVVADYNMAEIRVLAHESRDKAMCRILHENGDIHSETAHAVFKLKCAVEEVKHLFPDQRKRGKAVTFGVAYGMGPQGLARRLGISVDEARRYIDNFFHRFEGVYRWKHKNIAEAKSRGYVETLLGRRRRAPNIQLDPQQYGEAVARAERQLTNAPIQGGVSDIIRCAMALVDSDPFLREHEAAITLQVHDELVVESAWSEDAPLIATRVKELMENALPLRVPLVADVGIGPNWDDGKAA